MIFRRKPKPEPAFTETVPTFLVKDERIVDVVFTEWSSEDGNRWRMQPKEQLPAVAKEYDAIVFETPVGCKLLQIGHAVWPGDTMILHDSANGEPLMDCQGLQGWAEEVPVRCSSSCRTCCAEARAAAKKAIRSRTYRGSW